MARPASEMPRWRRWIRRVFLLWATFAMLYLANTVRTRGVEAALLTSGSRVAVEETAAALSFMPVGARPVGLVFLCGAGVAAEAYAPLLRPIADVGYPVVVVKLPYRFAPLEGHRSQAITRALSFGSATPSTRWVIGGHSLGAALAARAVHQHPSAFAALVLIATTHPRDQDLSGLALPVTKIYATLDGVAPADRVLANARLLPAHTQWIAIEGGNHSQFGHYGHQLFDGSATIDRDTQQAETRQVLLDLLRRAADERITGR